MSAKVIKKETAPALASFQFPSLGGAAEASARMQPFVFPEIGRSHSASPLAATAGPAENFAISPDRGVDDLVESARDEARRLIEAAEAQCAVLEQAAAERGLAEARRTFEAEVATRVAMESADLRQRLVNSIDEIASLAHNISQNVEQELLEFALEIARKIVRREVSMDREVALTLVKISLAKLHNRTFAKIHVNPDDYSFIEEHRERLGFQGSLETIADASISPGGCLIHTETGEIDARIESQFDEIAHGLL